ncbi:MCE family protein [Synechococcus sp. CS-1325]|uniref:MlaD family protein n=1 Tax=Synechococcus sp. CS-1325 TaxID=2847979 RepID=UPI000DB0E4CF|nr:MlaD family protein [Synechococcus sp. CS-1325]MCT0200056.1 MCE family protein [Synechococcus sp. CS-1325]PZU97466.1 MAG: MCE family protein [Cyanobium sp.]
MRRSVREALVGFTLLGAVVGSFGLWLWLRGVSLSQNNWIVKASFEDAAGLADRSPVIYRGVQVGSVKSVKTTSAAVLAELEISDPRLRLARPTIAQVQTGSLLGGDAQVALISTGNPLAANGPNPRDPNCDKAVMVCAGNELKGVAAASLSSVTELMQKLLAQAEREQILPQIASTTRSFDATSKEAQVFLKEAQRLVKELNAAVGKADPILANLNAASADAATAGRHVRNLTATLDNPKTLAELKTTVSNAQRLTARVDAVGGDVNKLTSDPVFMDGVRSVAIGLGQLFDELYPAQTGLARDQAEKGRAGKAKPAE